MKLEGDIDELVFDYLEGNLDKEEEEAFNLLKEENETFGHHVRLWQNAYVTEALPSTTALEERCLLKGRPRTSVVTNAGFIAFIVGVMLFVPSSITEPALKTTPPEIAIEQIDEKEFPAFIPIVKPAPVVEVPEHEPVIYPVDETRFEPRIKDLWISVPIDVQSNVIRSADLSLPRYNRTAFSAREIEKMKRRQLQRRRTAEFKAGNIPYVVPLNTKNF